ncbi:ribosome maturation protein, partial [Penicillium fimorum]
SKVTESKRGQTNQPASNETTAEVFYKGSSDDFIVFVDDLEASKAWRSDRSISLVNVVNAYNIFVTQKSGAQDILNEASKAMLENEFGSSDEDHCITKIL